MAVFVVLALALLVAAVGMVVVATVVLLRHVRLLSSALQDASERVSGLATELQEETAVTSIEAGALQQRLSDLRGRRQPLPDANGRPAGQRTLG